MKVLEWLESRNEIGFSSLNKEERNAIMEFSLLWSLFECKVLKPEGEKRRTIEDSVKEWVNKGLLTDSYFKKELIYFQLRYFQDGEFTDYFKGTQDIKGITLNNPKKQELIEKAIKNEGDDRGDTIAGLLLTIYALRNNFFHGDKWDFGIRGQLENFNHANSVLMQAIELETNQPGR